MNFDLNIKNYTRDELIDMFELPKNFDENIIEIKEAKMRENINNNKTISSETKQKTLDFIREAKQALVYTRVSSNQPMNNEQYASDYNLILKESPDPNMPPYVATERPLNVSKLETDDNHDVQVRPFKSYISNKPNEFYQGRLNPLAKTSVRKLLNIDTRFRDNYYTTSSTNFHIFLPTTFREVFTMQLNAIELPTTYYTISKQYNNDFFWVAITDLSGNITKEIVEIPAGNYTPSVAIQVINNILLTKNNALSNVVFALDVANISGNGLILVGVDNTADFSSIELDFQSNRQGISDIYTPLTLKLGWELGFRNGLYVNNLNYVTEAVANLTGPNYFFLVVDDFNNNMIDGFYSAFNNSILNKNILARISLQANPFNVLLQNNLISTTQFREYFGPVSIQTLQVQLLDEYGRIVDLNGSDFSFCLTLISGYDF